MRWVSTIVILCLCLVSCNNQSELIFESDGDLDLGPPDEMEGEGELVHVSFEMSEVNVTGQIGEIRFLDDAENNLGSASGSVNISPNGVNAAIIPMPNQFWRLDADFGRLDLRPGGGDGEGSLSSLLLPHFVITRDGGRWENITIRFNMENYQLAETKEERRALLKDLLNGLEVLEDGEVVGHGDYEKTMALLSPEGWVVEEEIQYSSSSQGQYIAEQRTNLTWKDSGVEMSWEDAQSFCEQSGMTICSRTDWAYHLDVTSYTDRLVNPEVGISEIPHWLPDARVYDVQDGSVGEPSLSGAAVLCIDYGGYSLFPESFTPESMGLAWEETDETLAYEEARNYCETATIQGVKGWRLPGIRESALINLTHDGVEEAHWAEEMDLWDESRAWAWQGEIWESLGIREMLSVSCVRSFP